MKTKKLLTLGLMIAAGIAALNAGTLNLFIDYNRFLDKDKSTILLVDYQIPYRNLVFIAQENGYFAEVQVKVELMLADSVVVHQEVMDKIGISNKADAANQQKSYLNRLSFSLWQPSYTVRFTAIDTNSQNIALWVFTVDSLPAAALMSDVELNSEVRADSLQYLEKFKRNQILYKPQPSILINKSISDYAYLYLETYPEPSDMRENCLLNLYLEKDSLQVMDEYLNLLPQSSSESLSLKIPLEDLQPGKYSGSVAVVAGERTEERSFDFVLVEDREEFIFLFPNPDDEYELMRIFLGSRTPGNWKDLSLDKKKRYGTQFWKDMATKTKRSISGIMSLVQERIDYANQHFGHLKSGWTSDMGRIYIRNGAPDDIEKDISSDQSRFVRKDFQIWKYSSGMKPVYLFIDIQMNGNYRLIYVEGDDMETSNPDWQRYMGSDFDETRLNN